MKAVYSLICGFMLLLTTGLQAQTTRYVTAKSGLNMRTGAAASAKVVQKVPFGETVKMEEKSYKRETISGKVGHWRKCTYKGKTGFMFDAYLSKDKPGEGDAQTGEGDAESNKPGTAAKPGQGGAATKPGQPGQGGGKKPETDKPAQGGANKPTAGGAADARVNTGEVIVKANLVYADNSLSSFDLLSAPNLNLNNVILGEGSAEQASEQILLNLMASQGAQGKTYKVLVEDLDLRKVYLNKTYILGAKAQEIPVSIIGCGRTRIRLMHDNTTVFNQVIPFTCEK